MSTEPVSVADIVAPAQPDQALTAEVLGRAVAAREGLRNGYPDAPPEQYGLRGGAQAATRGYMASGVDGVAEMRAWAGLVAQIGEGLAMTLLRGGAIPITSALWPTVVYLVKPEIILVVREGQVVQRLCLTLADGGSIWDAVANRISLLQAGADGEVEVWARGNAS